MAKANASTTVELDQVKEWVNDPCFRGHGIKATADPKLSCLCKICGSFMSPTCKNDIKKHCGITGKAGKTHLRKKKEKEEKEANELKKKQITKTSRKRRRPSSDNDDQSAPTNSNSSAPTNSNSSIKHSRTKPKIQTQITSIVQELDGVEFDFYLAYLSSGIATNGIIKFIDRFDLKKKVRYSQRIPQGRVRASQRMEPFLACGGAYLSGI
eukprot:52937_1